MLLESLPVSDRDDLGTGLRVTEELEGGGIIAPVTADWPAGVLGPDTAVSDTPGRLAIRKAEDDLILLSGVTLLL